MAQFHSSVPVRHDSVMVNQHTQYPDPEVAYQNSGASNHTWT